MIPLPAGHAPVHHPNCFGCSTENPQSLGVRMVVRDDLVVVGEVTYAPHHEGGPGLAHGGAVSAVFDDLLGAVPSAHRLPAVTASLSVQFRAPVLLGAPVALDAWLERRDGRKLHIAGRMRDAGGVLLAEATGLFLVVDVEHFRVAGQPVPEAWAGWGADTPPVAP